MLDVLAERKGGRDRCDGQDRDEEVMRSNKGNNQ